MKRFKYLGFYNIESNNSDQRIVSPAAGNKMSYIIKVLERICDRVCVVSASKTNGRKNSSVKILPLSENASLTLFFSIGKRSIFHKVIDYVLMKFQVLFYLLGNLGKNDILLVYHSLMYIPELILAKRIKGFRLILEVEEIYADVINNNMAKKKELKLASMADAFVFPTHLLDKELNRSGKPSVIIHGTYLVEPDRNCKFNDNKIHVVYAGTLDPRKGCGAAVAAARFLSENYHIHILGFGSEKQIREMRELTKENSIPGHAMVTYDGLLSGEDYLRFIQSCDIGLSPQNPDAEFNATSFPSKVLSYMSNGLRVVSIRIEAIERSAVGDLITYYDQQTPECIAQAIMNIDMKRPYDSRKRIAELDRQFEVDLKNLIEEVSNEDN